MHCAPSDREKKLVVPGQQASRAAGGHLVHDPWTYLRELLLRLHDDDPRLDENLPDQWAAHHPEAVLTYRLEESRRKAATRSTPRRHARDEPNRLISDRTPCLGRTLTQTRSFTAQQRPVIPLPPPTAASFGPALNSQRIPGTHNRFVKRSRRVFQIQQKGLAWVQGRQ